MAEPALTIELFNPLINQTFTVSPHGSHEFSLVLIEVKKVPNYAKLAREPFTLLWRGPKTPILPQQTYRFRHEAFGTVEIFMTAVRDTPEGIEYESVFN